MELERTPGESRGYWKYHAPSKWFKQAKATGKINNEKSSLLFDSGAEISIIDTAFARKVGCVIDESQRQECVGIGESAYLTVGRTRLKVTLVGSLVYYFDAWVGDQPGHDAILGMDFMVPAGIRLDLADGTLYLPVEVRVELTGRRPLYGSQMQWVTLDQDIHSPAGGIAEIPTRSGAGVNAELWITRGEKWVPTIATVFGRSRYLQITNVSDTDCTLDRNTRLGIWLAPDSVPLLWVLCRRDRAGTPSGKTWHTEPRRKIKKRRRR